MAETRPNAQGRGPKWAIAIYWDSRGERPQRVAATQISVLLYPIGVKVRGRRNLIDPIALNSLFAGFIARSRTVTE
jgi:hypothetical protein